MITLCPWCRRGALRTREPIPLWTQGCITLLGDAAHATLPFLAQGAVHAIEDGMVLSRCLEAVPAEGIQQALARDEAARIERTSRMVRGAMANTDRFHSRELATEES